MVAELVVMEVAVIESAGVGVAMRNEKYTYHDLILLSFVKID